MLLIIVYYLHFFRAGNFNNGILTKQGSYSICKKFDKDCYVIVGAVIQNKTESRWSTITFKYIDFCHQSMTTDIRLLQLAMSPCSRQVLLQGRIHNLSEWMGCIQGWFKASASLNNRGTMCSRGGMPLPVLRVYCHGPDNPQECCEGRLGLTLHLASGSTGSSS